MERRIVNRLIYEYLIGEISESDRKKLEDWVNDTPENKAFFDKINASQEISETFTVYKKIDYKKAFSEFVSHTGHKVPKIQLSSWLKYAAAIVLLIALSTPVYYLLQKDEAPVLPGYSHAVLITEDGSEINLQERGTRDIASNNTIVATNLNGTLSYHNTASNSEAKYNTIKVPRGGEYRITLSDGTKVHMNSESTLTYPIAFKGDTRDVELKGEAYFEIAPDKDKPFYVLTDEIKVKQYGTAFNVKNRKSDVIEVVLIHGSVSLISGDDQNEYKIKPSQLASYSKSSKDVGVETVDVEPYVAWTEGKFIFNDKTLKEIMETLSLWYDVDIHFEDKSFEKLRFTGNIPRKEPIENILKSIEFTTEVKMEVKNKTVFIND